MSSFYGDDDDAATPQTEDGLALAFVRRNGAQYRYVPERGRWLRWDGHRWLWDIAGQSRERMRELARELDASSKDSVRFKARSLSAVGVTGALRLAATDADVVVPISGLDSDPWVLNTPAGIVDLRTGLVRLPDPAVDMVTKSTSVALGAASDAPRWAAFLKDTFGGDADLADYVQRLLGNSLIGVVTDHVLPFGFGAGRNGKSVLMAVVMHVLGIGDNGYAIAAPSDFLMARSMPPHPTDLARLAGARLVVCQEINADQRFDEAKVKQLTGGDQIAARFMRMDYFTFTPTHHLFVLGNHKPEVRDGGFAFWRRLRLIPFEHIVPDGQVNKDLTAELIAAEGPGILGWLVDGAIRATAEGIGEPAAVISATASYQMDEDTVARFVAEVCARPDPDAATIGPQYQVRVAALRRAYEVWSRELLLEPVSAKAFSQRIRDLGVELRRREDSRLFVGIQIKPEYANLGRADDWADR